MLKLINILALTIFISNCDKAPEAPKADATTAKEVKQVQGTSVKLDAQKSIIKWIGTKLKGKHNGTVKISDGEIIINEGKIVGGKFSIDMPTLESDDLKTDKDSKAKLEGHLKSEDFFDVQKFPKATFEITSISENTDGTSKVDGNLTIKGVSNGISFPAKIKVEGNKGTAKANFNINRQKWGITYPGQPDNLIRDEINFDLDLSTL